jgi:hypothetical protein
MTNCKVVESVRREDARLSRLDDITKDLQDGIDYPELVDWFFQYCDSQRLVCVCGIERGVCVCVCVCVACVCVRRSSRLLRRRRSEEEHQATKEGNFLSVYLPLGGGADCTGAAGY